VEDDYTEGYQNGDDCPQCGGLIEIRNGSFIPEPGTVTTDDGDEDPIEINIEYAQCSSCPWSTFPG
jgi:hypothetical protein